MRPTIHTARKGAAWRALTLGLTVWGVTACVEPLSVDGEAETAGGLHTTAYMVTPARVVCGSLGETFRVRGEAVFNDGSVQVGGGGVATWPDSAVVGRQPDGTFVCRQNGETELTFRPDSLCGPEGCGRLTQTVTVIVEQRAHHLQLGAEGFMAPPHDVLRLGSLGETREVMVWAADSLGSPMEFDLPTVEWSTDDAEVASATGDGRLHAAGEGRTRLHANSGALFGTVDVEVDATLSLQSCVVAAGAGPASECAALSLTVAEEQGGA